MLIRLANEWDKEKSKPRGQKVTKLLLEHGHPADALHFKAAAKVAETHVFTDAVCMSLLEYYAFEADQSSGLTALRNYRILARSSLRSFIYNRCGYDPHNAIPAAWNNYRERILSNDQVPIGYFLVFREMADLVIHMIQGGCPIDHHTVPDISVGQRWSKHWVESGFDGTYGLRKKHEHYYPESFPQSASNPQEAYIYPNAALGAFREWIYVAYIPTYFPQYVDRKVKIGDFLPGRGQLLVEALTAKAIERQP